MENNKICSNCGRDNNINANFCVNCGVALRNSNTINLNDDKKGNIYAIVSLLLYFGGGFILTLLSLFIKSSIISTISALNQVFSLAGIVTMIAGRVKYPNNKALKVVMWIIIATIIISLIVFVLFFLWCFITCYTMDTSGCS